MNTKWDRNESPGPWHCFVRALIFTVGPDLGVDALHEALAVLVALLEFAELLELRL
jgi:hypothetical protein